MERMSAIHRKIIALRILIRIWSRLLSVLLEGERKGKLLRGGWGVATPSFNGVFNRRKRSNP